ncbi:MAG: hypothetical protein ABI759_27140 [Candidatus Solibacter sp.]
MRFAFLLLFPILAAAQEDHSQHQHPVAGLGNVDFPTTCNPPAQQAMTRGVAMLHSFGYEEARRTFGEAAKADPACVMAHWGIARTWYHPVWAPPTADELKQGAAALDLATHNPAKSPREQGYIDALAVFYRDWQTVDHITRARNYEKALGELSSSNPKDDEAAIFHALQLVAIGYLDPTDKTYAWQKRGSAILNRVLPNHADHPGVAHYIIHAVDYPSLAELGLKAARAYAAIAPDSPHALHMPSHIFTRLGMWDDSIVSNLASAKSGVAQAERLHGRSGSFDELHALDYLMYAYLQEAKDTSAQKVLARMSELKQLDENQFAAAYAFAASPARWALERHDWKAAAALQTSPTWFPWDRYRNMEALALYAKAIGAARAGDVKAARAATAQVDAILKQLPATRDYDWGGSLGAQWEAANALIAWAEGRKQEALRLLRAAADHEDAVDKHPVTPGALLPVREMLADLLMAEGVPGAALLEYEAVLKTAPRRFNATAGAAMAADKSGDKAKARAYATQLLEVTREAEVQRPEMKWARAYTSN